MLFKKSTSSWPQNRSRYFAFPTKKIYALFERNIYMKIFNTVEKHINGQNITPHNIYNFA